VKASRWRLARSRHWAALTAAMLALAAGSPLSAAPSAPAVLAACHGDAQPLVVSSQMPYALVQVGPARGYFVLDFASTASVIDPRGFPRRARPSPLPGTTQRFADFDFFGPWGVVTLSVQDHSRVRGSVAQAGILGTDFLAQHAYTLDYGRAGKGASVFRQQRGATCTDAQLRSEGFAPLTTKGYYSDDPSTLLPGVPRVPTVPVRIGGVAATAQLDTGFDDNRARHSVNINRALYDELVRAGVQSVAVPTQNMMISTCRAGLSEAVSAYRLPKGKSFELVATDGRAARSVSDAMLFVKDAPSGAQVCGGIGTWATPAAQMGASFYVEARRVVIDPFRALVWMPAQ
jgi:hypothetical protein